jgi:hypothetical protein
MLREFISFNTLYHFSVSTETLVSSPNALVSQIARDIPDAYQLSGSTTAQ